MLRKRVIKLRVCIITYDEYINIPFIMKYEDILKQKDIPYDVIFWDRRNNNLGQSYLQKNHYIFKSITKKSKISKIVPFLKWRNFVFKILKKNKYDKLIIITTIPGLLIQGYLINKYREKYLLDIRDFTYENFRFYKEMVMNLIKHSEITMISSEGFKNWLKISDKICLTHNISNIEKESKIENIDINKNNIVIGFVGGIRFYNENCKLINALKDKYNIQLLYVGKVHPGIYLENYCKLHNIGNVLFEPAYTNDEKPGIYEKIDIINAVYGANTQVVKTALPNKLYDCILFKKPIMVSKGTYLSEIVEKYHLGFSVDIDQNDIYDSLISYLDKFDSNKFLNGCKNYKEVVIKEEKYAKDRIENFLNS